VLAELRDGARIEIRPIRPDDRAELAAGMERLSHGSRYRRFLSPADELSEQELDYRTRVDHHDHEALVARDPESGEGVGVARFVRSASDPEAAEFAVPVADDWHGRGVGTVLLLARSASGNRRAARRSSRSSCRPVASRRH
jgi:GNAT superfamily N-acetyltransferase